MNEIIDKIIECLNTTYHLKNYDIDNREITDSFYFENITDEPFYTSIGVKEDIIDFYTNISKSGVKNIILGGVYIGVNKMHTNNIPKFIEGDFKIYYTLCKNIHRYNSKVYFKIMPAYGREINFNKTLSIFKRTASIENDINDSMLVSLPASDTLLQSLINEACDISYQVKGLNFDGIMIDATFNNLFGSLSSREFNKRRFGYFSKEYEFLCKLIKSIKKRCGAFKIIVKLSLFSFVRETINDYKKISTIKNINSNVNYKEHLTILNKLISSGVDGFEFEFGTFENKYLTTFNKYISPEIYNDIYKLIQTKLKDNIKEDNLPFILYNNNQNINKNTIKLLNNKIINFINITKNIYSDLNFVKKFKNKIDYNNCIQCGYCENIAKHNGDIKCFINPRLMNETNLLNGNKKQVAVVGGGVSGLYSAITLAERNFKVDLYESNNILNKTGIKCEIYNNDEYLHLFNYYLENKVKQYVKLNNINIINKYIKSEDLTNSKYTAIIIATGFIQENLCINGAVQNHVKSIYDILENKNTLKQKKHIVLYAKTELSLKFALYLIDNNYNVSIITKFDNLKNANHSNLFYYLYRFSINNVNFYIEARIKKINEDNIDLITNKNLLTNTYTKIHNMFSNKQYKYIKKAVNIDCDLLIYEPNLKPNNKLYYDLVKTGYKGEIYLVGSALEIGDMANDIESAYFVGKNL